MPQLHLAGYDGPLDMLLDLAERQRIDLGRIAILDLVEQFVAAMEQLSRPDVHPRVAIERRAEWLIVATQLLLLRSRLLFPINPQAADAAVRDAARAIERLEGMRFIRAAAAWLDRRPQLSRDVFARPRRGPDPRVASTKCRASGGMSSRRSFKGGSFSGTTASRYDGSVFSPNATAF